MSGEWIEIRYQRGRRARFLGLLLHAVRRRAPVRIFTGCTDPAALALELKILVETRAADLAGGAGASLGWLGGRAILSRLASSRLLLGGALLGASAASALFGGFLLVYSFRMAAGRDARGGVIIEGTPRLGRGGASRGGR